MYPILLKVIYYAYAFEVCVKEIENIKYGCLIIK